jgi:hypothetical protein
MSCVPNVYYFDKKQRQSSNVVKKFKMEDYKLKMELFTVMQIKLNI